MMRTRIAKHGMFGMDRTKGTVQIWIRDKNKTRKELRNGTLNVNFTFSTQSSWLKQLI